MTRRIYADGYAEAIPIDELVKLARADVDSCAVKSDEVVRKCAERVVRSKLCPCAASVDSIVAAVADEYRRQLAEENNQ